MPPTSREKFPGWKKNPQYNSIKLPWVGIFFPTYPIPESMNFDVILHYKKEKKKDQKSYF